MKKLSGKHERLGLLYGLVVFVVAILAIRLTAPSYGFSSMGDMGTSATGMALIRSIQNPPPGTTSPFMGYVLNGTIQHYWNWPPYGFRLYAFWLESTGLQGLDGARMLSMFVYGLTAFLFYCLLRKNHVGIITAGASSLVFIFLPMHLKYGHMVYADIWLPFFWTVALLALNAQTLKRYWLFFLIVLMGTAFMWFVIFLLPIPLLLKLLDKFKCSKKMSIAIWIGVCLWAAGLVWFLVANFDGQYRISKLENWSFNYLFRDFSGFLPVLINRFLYLGYESFSLLAVFIISYRPLKQYYDAQVLTEYKGLIRLITILFAGLLLYVLIMPVWFVSHHYGLGMFSLLIATMIALVLGMMEKHSKRMHVPMAVLAISLTMMLYLLFPSNNEKVAQINQISQVINEQQFEQKPCIFIDLEDFHHWDHAVEFGIKELTDAYIFNKDFRQEISSRKDVFQYAKKQLIEIGLSNYQTDGYWLITNHKSPHSQAGIKVLELEEISLYKFRRP